MTDGAVLTTAAQRGAAPETMMMATGLGAVVLGGLVAAATGPLGLANGSWAAAYLVLVVGVAQGAMGYSRTRRPEQRHRTGWAQFSCWNAGSAAVIIGTLVARPWMVDAGSVLLVIALVLALDATRPRAPGATASPWPAVYRGMLLLLAISIPIGMVLSHLRHS